MTLDVRQALEVLSTSTLEAALRDARSPQRGAFASELAWIIRQILVDRAARLEDTGIQAAYLDDAARGSEWLE